MSGWQDIVKSASRATLRAGRAARDAGPAKTHGAGPGWNRDLTPEEWTRGMTLGAMLDEALLDPKVRMRVDGKGTQTRTVANWVQSIGGGDAETLTEWQQRMYRAGLYENEPIYGYFDQATAGALSFLATDVIRNGNRMTPGQILDLLGDNVDRDGDGIPDNAAGGDQRRGQVIETTNPLDLREYAQGVSSNLMGRELDEASADRLMSGFAGTQVAAQQQAIGIADSSTDGTVVSPASPQAYAEQRLREENAVEIDSFAALGAFNELLRMVGLAG